MNTPKKNTRPAKVDSVFADALAASYEAAAAATIAEAAKHSFPYDLSAFDPDAFFKASHESFYDSASAEAATEDSDSDPEEAFWTDRLVEAFAESTEIALEIFQEEAAEKGEISSSEMAQLVEENLIGAICYTEEMLERAFAEARRRAHAVLDEVLPQLQAAAQSANQPAI